MVQRVATAFSQCPRRRASGSNRKVWHVPIVLIVTLVALQVFAGAAWAGPPDVEIGVTPASVEIPTEGTAEVLVVARNPAADEVRDVRLSWFTDAGVEVQVESPASNVLVPYGALTWILRLSRVEDRPVAGDVHLRVDYVWEGETEDGAAPCVAVGSLQVRPREPQAVEQVAEIRVETALESLNKYRPGAIYLVISNTTDVPVQVKRISPRGPSFVAFAGPELSEGVTVAPGEAQAFPYEVSAPGTVRPGQHLLLFDVALEWEDAGRVWTRRDFATHEVEIGVFGESAILTAVGVPSLLILPGVLMLLTVQLLWRFVGPKTEFPIKAVSAESGLITVTLSLLAAVLYPVVTEWAGASRNYFTDYELSDVMWVWFGSIVVAAAGYSLAVGGRNLATRVVKGYRTPSKGDKPIAVLRKLHRQGLGLELARVDAQIEGAVQRGYLLQPQDEDREKIWIGPSIVVEWLAGADEALQTAVGKQLGAKGSPRALADLLKQGRARGELWERWKPMGPLTGPREVTVADIEKYLEPTVIVEQE